jgi:hypothetical protein
MANVSAVVISRRSFGLSVPVRLWWPNWFLLDGCLRETVPIYATIWWPTPLWNWMSGLHYTATGHNITRGALSVQIRRDWPGPTVSFPRPCLCDVPIGGRTATKRAGADWWAHRLWRYVRNATDEWQWPNRPSGTDLHFQGHVSEVTPWQGQNKRTWAVEIEVQPWFINWDLQKQS